MYTKPTYFLYSAQSILNEFIKAPAIREALKEEEGERKRRRLEEHTPLLTRLDQARPLLYIGWGKKLAERNRMMRNLADGIDVCVTVTLVDELVLARSAFHHSVNYRSVVILGKAEMVTAESEKNAALEAFSNHIIPGRWAGCPLADTARTKSHDRPSPSDHRSLSQDLRRRSGR